MNLILTWTSQSQIGIEPPRHKGTLNINIALFKPARLNAYQPSTVKPGSRIEKTLFEMFNHGDELESDLIFTQALQRDLSKQVGHFIANTRSRLQTKTSLDELVATTAESRDRQSRRKDLKRPSNLKAVFRNIRNHLAGNVVDITRDEALAQEIVSVLFCKIYDEVNTGKDEVVTFRSGQGEKPQEVQKRIVDLFEKKVKSEYSDAFSERDAITR